MLQCPQDVKEEILFHSLKYVKTSSFYNLGNCRRAAGKRRKREAAMESHEVHVDHKTKTSLTIDTIN